MYRLRVERLSSRQAAQRKLDLDAASGRITLDAS